MHLSGDHASLHIQVLNPLKELAKDVTVERRKHLATGADLHRQLKNQLDTLDRVRERREGGREGGGRQSRRGERERGG